MNKRPKIELLTPDLDLSITFVPGYDLLEQNSDQLSEAEVNAIALTLWELSGSEQPSCPAWRATQLADSYEGNTP